MKRSIHPPGAYVKNPESLGTFRETIETISHNDLLVRLIIYFFRNILQCPFLEDAMVNIALYWNSK